jgi:hypothetical protein
MESKIENLLNSREYALKFFKKTVKNARINF